jgi:NADP-dependent 3-hydroxy acid dehydrogenase YdfG
MTDVTTAQILEKRRMGPSGALAGTVALVTGASSGIGRAIALAFAAEGVSLCLVGRDEDRLAQAEAGVSAAGAPNAISMSLDLTDQKQQELLIKRVEQRYGGVDILVHCAGIYARGAMQTASVTNFDALFAANVRAPYSLTQRMLPSLVRRKGEIVFINSTQGISASADVGQFAATQHAMTAVADSLREEINDSGVRVAVLHVGTTATPRQEQIYSATGRTYMPERLMQPGDVAEVVMTILRLPRTAEVTKLTIRPMQKP